MDIPEGYRSITKDERIVQGDMWLENGQLTPVAASIVGSSRRDPNYGLHYLILRKQTSPWIAMSERKPCEAGWYFVKWAGCCAATAYWSEVYNKWEDISANKYANRGEIEHWMEIPPAPKITPPPITILEGTQTREIEFRKDGSMKVGCVEVSKEKFEEILVRRGEVVKAAR